MTPREWKTAWRCFTCLGEHHSEDEILACRRARYAMAEQLVSLPNERIMELLFSTKYDFKD